nr:MAG TPA: hypothetical protein [Caudoviricetes sp.]
MGGLSGRAEKIAFPAPEMHGVSAAFPCTRESR